MPSSSSNITGVHFTLIFFVMLSIILGVVSYLKIKESSELRGKSVALEDEKRKIESSRQTMDDEIQALKKKIGYPAEPVGLDSTDANTVLAKVGADLQKAGVSRDTINTALTELGLLVANTREQLKNTEDLLKAEEASRQQQRSQYEARLAEATRARDAAERQLSSEQERYKGILAQKDDEIRNLTGDKRRLELELAAKQDELDKVVKDLTQKHSELVTANNLLREELDDIRKVSFEVADGEIRYVDHANGLVWINRGSADNLKPQTTFSVYTPKHQGVGRGSEDIIGSIEVTEIVEPHLAKARIVERDIFAPISVGCPIYTPVWSPGRVEKFAIAGIIDFDGDGQSDREALRAVIRASGGEVSHELKADGTRSGGKLSAEVKFLIRGDIPEDTTVGHPDERKANQKILAAYKEMKEESRAMAVREVRLHEFRDYIGHKQSHRMWKPGMKAPWALKSGSHSTGVDETIDNRSSTGQTSGVYTRRGRISQPESSGQTSKLFRGGSGGY